MPQQEEHSILNSIQNSVSTIHEPDVTLGKLLRTLLVLSFFTSGINFVSVVFNIVRGYSQINSLIHIPYFISLIIMVIYIGIWFKKKIAIYLFLFFYTLSIIISIPITYIVSAINSPNNGLYFVIAIIADFLFFGLWIFAFKRDWRKFR